MVCLGSRSPSVSDTPCWEPTVLDESGEDFKWPADTTLNDNEFLGMEKVVYHLIPFHSCPGECLSWLLDANLLKANLNKMEQVSD